jgi:hypothetical protein
VAGAKAAAEPAARAQTTRENFILIVDYCLEIMRESNVAVSHRTAAMTNAFFVIGAGQQSTSESFDPVQILQY